MEEVEVHLLLASCVARSRESFGGKARELEED
jgi:hypothetical protein